MSIIYTVCVTILLEYLNLCNAKQTKLQWLQLAFMFLSPFPEFCSLLVVFFQKVLAKV